MSRQFFFYLRLFLFWLFLFFILRVVFVLLNANQFANCHAAMLFRTFAYGGIMDVSMSSYLLAFFILVFFITLPFGWNVFRKSAKWAVTLLVVLACLVNLCDAALLQYWGTRVNEKAVSVLLFPRSALDAVRSSRYVLSICIFVFLTVSLLFLSRKFFQGRNAGNDAPRKGSAAILSLLLIPLLIIGARGGIQKYPIGKSSVFFSDNFSCNYAALNPLWNFTEVLIDLSENSGTAFRYFPESVVNREIEKVFTGKDTVGFPRLFTVGRPNIVMILLESFSAENLPKLSGIPVAVKLNQLCDSSLWFENFYAGGSRSEHALIALLSGTPPLPGKSLLREGSKMIRLPMLAKMLKDSLAYSLEFYNTYDINYARARQYLLAGGFGKIITDKDFEECRHHQWGAYDECLFDYVLRDLQNNKPPFFSMVLTSVSHEPFNADVRKVFPGNRDSDRYKNTIRYTDSCLYAFLMKARLKPWYRNTVFIIMADHGHTFPNNRKYYEPLHFKIPFLVYGEALKREYRGKSLSIPCSQIDFPATLLHQLGMKSGAFPISRDMTRKEKNPFTFFIFSDGLGYVSDNSQYSYNAEVSRIACSSRADGTDSLSLARGKMILQYLYDQYKKLN